MNLTQVSNRIAGGVRCVIEIPRRSILKYEYDLANESLKVLRKFSGTIPYNYGFIPKTMAPDGDCLDVIVWSDERIEPLSLVDCSIVGVLECKQDRVRDDKIIVSPFYEKRISPRISDIPSKQLTEWLEFIKTANRDSGKEFEFISCQDKGTATENFRLCNYDEHPKNPFVG